MLCSDSVIVHCVFMKFLDFLLEDPCLDLKFKCSYGFEGFTHPLGREEKSRVKGLVGLENVLRTLEYGLHCMP